MTYAEATAYLRGAAVRGSRPGLSRMTELMHRLGDPQLSLSVIHVAGTNGKGSFCAMLESVLRHAGYTTGLFTSPYLEDWREQIRLDGATADEDLLAARITQVAEAAEGMADPPTEFELTTALAYLTFRQADVAVAVVECGMGGRQDATNLLSAPLLSVITDVALDHQSFLGYTVEAIAAEKAGIIKASRPVLYGGRDPTVAVRLASYAAELGAPFRQKPEGLLSDVAPAPGGIRMTYGTFGPLFLPLLGRYQPHNAATVLETVFLLREQGLSLPDEAVRRGLASVSWKGRFEALSLLPPVFFDGGHNPDGVAAAVETVRFLFGDRRVLLITGVLRDKDYPTMAKALATVADTIFTVTPPNPRALDAGSYAAVFA